MELWVDMIQKFLDLIHQRKLMQGQPCLGLLSFRFFRKFVKEEIEAGDSNHES